MFSFFKKEKWVHLKTTTLTGITYAVGHPHEKKDGKVFIHYYESNKGNRKIECACSFTEVEQDKVDQYVRGWPTYQERIVRWLNGRYDPEIPKYSEIGEEDTANALRGKVE
jgi:hypothetical protein